MGQGAYISGIAHVALILWALVGGLFLRADDPLPVETMDVSVLTPEEFDQLVAAAQPAPAPDQAVTPEPALEPDPAPIRRIIDQIDQRAAAAQSAAPSPP